ncbi:hypothetical protein JCM10213_007966 [Rhodosporidiobolus nylandii]
MMPTVIDSLTEGSTQQLPAFTTLCSMVRYTRFCRTRLGHSKDRDMSIRPFDMLAGFEAALANRMQTRAFGGQPSAWLQQLRHVALIFFALNEYAGQALHEHILVEVAQAIGEDKAEKVREALDSIIQLDVVTLNTSS